MVDLRTWSRAIATAALVASASTAALAAPTPVPGGANAAAGVSGTLKSPVLFNGEVRVKKMALTKLLGTPDENYGDVEGKRWIVFRALMSNGQPHPADILQFDATISDADGVSIAAQPDKVRPMGSITSLAPGAAWHESVLFQVPSDFKPVKIVLVPGDKKFKAFRITLAPADVPAP